MLGGWSLNGVKRRSVERLTVARPSTSHPSPVSDCDDNHHTSLKPMDVTRV